MTFSEVVTWYPILSENYVVSCNLSRLCLSGCVAFVFLRHYADAAPFCVWRMLLPGNRRSATIEVEGCDPSAGFCRRRRAAAAQWSAARLSAWRCAVLRLRSGRFQRS